jgi:hypothetical protein
MFDLDEDAGLRSDLAKLGPAALRSLRRILEGSESEQNEVLRRLMTADAQDLATLVSMAATDGVVRLRVLRAIRDLGL